MYAIKIPGIVKRAAPAPTQDPVSLGQTFIAGLDPTGTGTFNLAQRAQRHGAHQAAGIAGGVLGGIIAVPALVSGAMSAAKHLSTMRGGSLGGKVMSLAGAFGRGALDPYKRLYHGVRATRAMDAGRRSGQFAPGTGHHIAQAMGLSGKPGEYAGYLDRALKYKTVMENKDVLKSFNALHSSVKGNTIDTAAVLGAAGGVGGLSSYLQYNQGRDIGDRLRGAGIER